MKWIGLISVVLVLVITNLAFSQTGFIEERTRITEGEATPQLEIWLQGDFGNGFGWYAWTLTDRYWSETYVGPTYSPVSWCQIGVALGIETHNSPTRYGLYGWLGKDKASIIGFYEDGGSGPWHQIVAGYQVLPWWSVSAMKETFLGVGPRTDFSVWQLKFHTALLRENGINTILLATAFNF